MKFFNTPLFFFFSASASCVTRPSQKVSFYHCVTMKMKKISLTGLKKIFFEVSYLCKISLNTAKYSFELSGSSFLEKQKLSSFSFQTVIYAMFEFGHKKIYTFITRIVSAKSLPSSTRRPFFSFQKHWENPCGIYFFVETFLCQEQILV